MPDKNLARELRCACYPSYALCMPDVSYVGCRLGSCAPSRTAERRRIHMLKLGPQVVHRHRTHMTVGQRAAAA